MPIAKDERDRVLQLIAEGKITAPEAAQLLDTLEREQIVTRNAPHHRTIRVRATHTNAKRQRAQVIATIPVSVMLLSIRLGARLLPQIEQNSVTDLMHHLEHGSTGRVLDIQDMENGERIEIFVE